MADAEQKRRADGVKIAVLRIGRDNFASSPLDVPSIKANISTQKILDIVREGRER